MIDKNKKTQQGFRERLEAFIRWRWFLFIPIAVAVTGAVIISLLLPPVYEAAALIQVNDKKIIDPLVEGIAVSPKSKEQIEGLIKQAQAWPRLKQIIDQFHMADDISSKNGVEDLISKLRKSITIEMKGNDLIQVSFRSRTPLMAQEVANSITDNFIATNSKSKKEEARRAIEFLGDQLKIYRKKLEESEKNFSTHKIDADLRSAQNRQKLLKDQLSTLEKIVPSQVKMEQSPVFSRLQSHLAELELERARLMVDAKEGHPRVAELSNEIAELKTKLDAEMKQDMVRESVSMVNPSYFQTEQELKQLEMDLDYLYKRKKELSENSEKPLKAVSEEELSAMQTGKKVDEDIYQMLLKQMESAYVSERLQDSDKGSRLSVIEYARLPVAPVKPVGMKVIILGLFVGGLVGGGFVMTMESLDRSFRTAEDAKSALNLPVLGSISRIVVRDGIQGVVAGGLINDLRAYLRKHKLLSELRFIAPYVASRIGKAPLSPQVIIYHDPKSTVAEEYRIVRTNIHSIASDRPLNTIMFTSSVRSEGKSTTAMNLAVSMADNGKNVLLIDCDLRRGVAHSLLNVPQGPGLTHVLSDNVSPDAVIVKTPIKNLSIIPCGSRPTRPSELLGSSRMEALLQKCNSLFDVVLLDAPPVINLPDASILSKFTDGVIFVVQAERTQREEVARAHAALEQARARVLGLVLTNVQYYIPKYLYDYYYGS